MHVTIHELAAGRFNQMGEEVLQATVKQTRGSGPEPTFKPDNHTSFNLTSKDAVGPIVAAEHIYDGTGSEVGRFFLRNDQRIGLVGEPYKKLIILLERIQGSGLKPSASMKTLRDAAFGWIEQRYDGRTKETLVTFLLDHINQQIRECEIWIPLHRVHLEQPVNIGGVQFHTITREMLDELESRLHAHTPAAASAAIKQRMDRDRKKLQGTAAAVVSVVAEPIRASEIARERAGKAVALLRFLSPANWHPAMRSYCTLLGGEDLRISAELTVEDGKISRVSNAVEDQRNQHHWTLTAAQLRQFPGLLQALSSLANDDSSKNEFQTKLLEALLLYSRNSVAREPADKLVYILAALEAMLLKNDSEPIQKNIGERMAFLVGDTMEARKEIVANVLAIYVKRSSFVHHGQGIEVTDTLASFMLRAWTCFYNLLQFSGQFETKEALIQHLEDRKLT